MILTSELWLDSDDSDVVDDDEEEEESVCSMAAMAEGCRTHKTFN